MSLTSSFFSASRRVLGRRALIATPLIGALLSAGTGGCAAPAKTAAIKAASAKPAKDIVIANFEGGGYPDGWAATGTAFGSGPVHGALGTQQAVTGFTGKGLVNTYVGNDDRAVGTLTSPPFVISRKYLSFLIGGGHHPGENCIVLVVNETVVRTATGSDSEQLLRNQWDISDLYGKTATIQIIDTATGQWGHINVDDIVLTNAKLSDEQTRLLASAMTAIRAAVPAAEADARRPAYHYHAPAQWMNDPNGPIYYKGWYHVFYQFNPYGPKWGNMHWGHARSKDLVNWVQMPPALWPSRSAGEDHIYSGSIFPRADGTPMAFYTSIGGRDPEQWGAVATSPDLKTWRKAPQNPLVSNANHGSDKVAEWRDPFLFKQDGVTYMLTGGGLNDHGVVLMYQAANPGLTAWKYLGPIFQHPDDQIHNIECPNIALIDGKWMLLTSTYGKVESFVGQLDIANRRFITEKRGVLADGSYASQLMRNADGDVVYYGWMHTEEGAGWNGYVTLPSVLHITSDGAIVSTPVKKFESLRGKHVQIADRALSDSLDLSGQISGKSLELIADIAPGAASSVTVHLRTSADGSQSLPIRYDVATRTLHVPGRRDAVLPASMGPNLKLHVFLDNGALDVYAADGAVVLDAFHSDVPAANLGVRLTVEGGAATVKTLDIYSMKPAVMDDSVFEK
jgi:beta-fructofuranosidase